MINILSILHRFLILLYILSHGSSCISAEHNTVRFTAQWLPQAQFAGYYVGAKKAIYEKYGINIDIIKKGPDRPLSYYLNNDYADIVTMFISNAIKLRASGVDIVNIGQMVNKSALILVTKKTSQIKTSNDFKNKSVGIWGFDFSIQPLALFKNLGLMFRLYLNLKVSALSWIT